MVRQNVKTLSARQLSVMLIPTAAITIGTGFALTRQLICAPLVVGRCPVATAVRSRTLAIPVARIPIAKRQFVKLTLTAVRTPGTGFALMKLLNSVPHVVVEALLLNVVMTSAMATKIARVAQGTAVTVAVTMFVTLPLAKIVGLAKRTAVFVTMIVA